MTDDDGVPAASGDDDRLRHWGRETVRTAPEIHVPVDRFRPRARTRSIAAIAAAAVVVSVALSVTLLRGGGGTSSPAGPVSTAPTHLPSAPRGFRLITFHGLTITVPIGWTLNQARCGTPWANTVLLPLLATAACGAGPAPAVTSVAFEGDQSYHQPLMSSRTTSLTIGGHAATETTGHTRPSPKVMQVITVTVPSLLASVTVTSPSSAEAQHLIGTLRVLDVDAAGCPVRSGYPNLRAHLAPRRPGADRKLIPGRPTGLRVCTYRATLLEFGLTADAHDRRTLVSAFDSLPKGLSRAPSSTYDAARTCRTRSTDYDSRGSGEDDTTAYAITASYATGPPVTVSVRLGWCGDLGASNGTRTGQRTPTIMSALESLDIVNDVPSDVEPQR